MEKTAIITGASRGIGRETALLFWRKGFSVVLNYCQNAAPALAMAEELNRLRPDSALAFRADVSVRAEVDAMVEAAGHLGAVEVLVNNAGIARQALFTDITAEEWTRIFAVNVDGMFHCTQAVLPQMLHRKRGKIINLSSMWGQVGGSCEVAYSASKGAVIAFTKALAQEVGPSGIQVNCVAPGVIETEMNGALSPETLASLREETPLGVLGTTADVAEAIWFLASPQADFITGQVLAPNGGMVV